MSRFMPLIAACCLPTSLALAGMILPHPLVLLNTSPSEPLGLYVRSAGPPGVGRIAAFRTPMAGRAYAAAYLPEIGPGGILKTLVAGPGDRACAEGDQLTVNQRGMGRIRARDSRGRSLPRWRGCLTLGSDQYLAFSNRIPNSFDSRYYGPVRTGDMIGVFAPVWVR
jgi:conjugative transfer signal peptidase TraF